MCYSTCPVQRGTCDTALERRRTDGSGGGDRGQAVATRGSPQSPGSARPDPAVPHLRSRRAPGGSVGTTAGAGFPPGAAASGCWRSGPSCGSHLRPPSPRPGTPSCGGVTQRQGRAHRDRCDKAGQSTPLVSAAAPGTDSAAMAARPSCACAGTAESVDRERAPMESINHPGGLRAAFTQPGRREEHRAKDPALPSVESWIPSQPRGVLGGTAPPGGRRKDAGGVMGGQ